MNNSINIIKSELTKSEIHLLQHIVQLVDDLDFIIINEGESPEERKVDFKIKLAIIKGKLKTMRKNDNLSNK
jgi:hypothetical protein